MVPSVFVLLSRSLDLLLCLRINPLYCMEGLKLRKRIVGFKRYVVVVFLLPILIKKKNLCACVGDDEKEKKKIFCSLDKIKRIKN